MSSIHKIAIHPTFFPGPSLKVKYPNHHPILYFLHCTLHSPILRALVPKFQPYLFSIQVEEKELDLILAHIIHKKLVKDCTSELAKGEGLWEKKRYWKRVARGLKEERVIA